MFFIFDIFGSTITCIKLKLQFFKHLFRVLNSSFLSLSLKVIPNPQAFATFSRSVRPEVCDF